jgi:hypothetical protein
MKWHIRARNMGANYGLPDVEADDESEAIRLARADSRRHNHGSDILVGLLVTAYRHEPGRTCEHSSEGGS